MIAGCIHHTAILYRVSLCLHVRSSAGTLRVPSSVSRVVQVPCRCPHECQEWCRYPTGAFVGVRSGADTLQVPLSVSGVVQIPYRCPCQCQEWCRYSADALVSVRSGAGTLQVPLSVSGVVEKSAHWVFDSAFHRVHH